MIQPGLERIGLLAQHLQFPWKAIHVAGTNGKGSICAYASALLHQRAVRVGRFTSPHLIHRWDCIQINERVVNESLFKRAEEKILELDQRENIRASEFELLTATAFQIFSEQNVQIGVVEVGMGGKLDATNILNNQVVSVIAKISRDHESFLGNTLDEIARHKAGILRPNVPYVVNPTNEWNVHQIIGQVAEGVGAGPLLHKDAPEFKKIWATPEWKHFVSQVLPFQQDNAVMAYLAVKEALKSLEMPTGQAVPDVRTLESTSFRGRFEQVAIPRIFGSKKRILVDGAHNEDAAQALRAFVDRNVQPSMHNVATRKEPVTWVLAMSESKDVRGYLARLLNPGDTVIATSFGAVDGMPWVKAMDPNKILEAAQAIHPSIEGIALPEPGVHRALLTAKHIADLHQPIIVTGSLYLVGTLMRELEAEEQTKTMLDLRTIGIEEQQRVGTLHPELLQNVSEYDEIEPASTKQDQGEAAAARKG